MTTCGKSWSVTIESFTRFRKRRVVSSRFLRAISGYANPPSNLWTHQIPQKMNRLEAVPKLDR